MGQAVQKLGQLLGRASQQHLYPGRVVTHPTAQATALAEVMDKRPEAYPLNYAINGDVPGLH
jgi:hypothetical protein